MVEGIIVIPFRDGRCESSARSTFTQVRTPLRTPSSKEPPLSALTKVFVVLLVICSLLLSAGIVVYVNQESNLRETIAAQETQLSTARLERAAEQSRAQAANTQLAQAVASAEARANADQQRIAEL